jgi:hypothetical protein
MSSLKRTVANHSHAFVQIAAPWRQKLDKKTPLPVCIRHGIVVIDAVGMNIRAGFPAEPVAT